MCQVVILRCISGTKTLALLTQRYRRFAGFCHARLLFCLPEDRQHSSGVLHRMSMSSLPSCVAALLQPLKELRHEWCTFGYTSTVIDRAVHDFAFAKRHAVAFTAWHSLYSKYRRWVRLGAVL